MSQNPFGPDFLWGAATSSFQIEGSLSADGRGPSVWDRFWEEPGRVWEDCSAATACDHYRRWREDVSLMLELGLKSYRFSLSWPRILPEGTGTVNSKGLDFYSRLVDELCSAGIKPMVTVFHWDYPLALQHRGGWLNRDSAQWFADYAHIVGAALGDRVKLWITLNEPQCFIGLGHHVGMHAPGEKLSWAEVLRAGHHALLAHGFGTQALRATVGDSQIGFAPVGIAYLPASEKPEDVAAARQATHSIWARNVWNSTWWMDPVFLGKYPEDGMRLYEKDLPEMSEEDLSIISQPMDFLGCNIYKGHSTVEDDGEGGFREVKWPPGYALTGMHWPVHPEVLYWGPRFLHERYGSPIFITENGFPNLDWIDRFGGVDDPARIDFVARHLQQLALAMNEGVPVRGYYYWSLLDNFEWADGYKHRFGLVYVDYQTQRRVLKKSASWYKALIASEGCNALSHHA